jgi:hypothetical protein
MWRHIFKLDRGKVFKGHAMELVHTENEIILINSYFNNVLTVTYNTSKNITTSDYTYYPIGAKIPKWYQELGRRLEALALPTKMVLKRDNYTCNFYGGSQIIFTYSEEYNGINFNNHYVNIGTFRKIRHMYSIIRENVKQLTDEDLCSFELESDHPYERLLVLPEDIFYK